MAAENGSLGTGIGMYGILTYTVVIETLFPLEISGMRRNTRTFIHEIGRESTE